MYKQLLAIAVVVIIILIICLRYSESEPFASTNFINKTRTVTMYKANWCNGCKLMKPIYEQVKHAVQGSGITFLEVDIDTDKQADISKIPTIRMRDEYGKLHEYKGGPDFKTLKEWIISPIPWDF